MRTMYMWMTELQLQFDAFLDCDSPYYYSLSPSSGLAVFYNNDQLFGVCTRPCSLLAGAGYPLVVPIHFIQHGFPFPRFEIGSSDLF